MPLTNYFTATHITINRQGQAITNTYQPLAGPSIDTVVDVANIALLGSCTAKRALFLSVEDSPEANTYPLDVDMIAIEFPSFTDGRGYSFAVHLRRQGFSGELRAVGDVYSDVLHYLLRCGFDSFELKPGKSESNSKGLTDFSAGYQAAVATKVGHNYQSGK